MKYFLVVLLVSIFIAGCGSTAEPLFLDESAEPSVDLASVLQRLEEVPPPPRSTVLLSDAARAAQDADQAAEPGSESGSEPTSLIGFLKTVEIPPHPRSELTLAELGVQEREASGNLSLFSAIPPPHPRVDEMGKDISGTGGLVAHAPLQRPTRQTEDGGLADNSGKTPAETPTATPTDAPPTAIPTQVVPEPATTPEPTQVVQDVSVVFDIVSEESTISYQVYEEFLYVSGRNLVTGKTQQVSGELVLTLGDEPTVESGYIEVNIDSMTSRDPRRDQAIRSNWLETERYPLAFFEVDSLQNGPESWSEGDSVEFQLIGALTLRNVTESIVFDVEATLTGGKILGSATAQILMTDFGFDPPAVPNLVEANDEVVVIVYLSAMAR